MPPPFPPNKASAGALSYLQDIGDGKEEPVEVLCDEVETVKGFCYLEDRLNASDGCETAVTARVRIGWMKFRECGELLLEEVFF